MGGRKSKVGVVDVNRMTYPARSANSVPGQAPVGSTSPTGAMGSSNRAITVLLVDDHAIVREGVRMILESAQDVQVVGEAADGHDAVLKVQELCPKVVLLDIALPGLGGAAAAREILSRRPKTRILVLTTHADFEVVRCLIEAGVRGYLTKDVASQQLLTAIREVNQGHTFFSPAVSTAIARYKGEPKRVDGESRPELSPRETAVFQLVAEGHSNRVAAKLLNISVKTVEKHRQRVMDKLDIHEVASLTRYALSRGLVDCRVSRGDKVGEINRGNETEMRQA